MDIRQKTIEFGDTLFTKGVENIPENLLKMAVMDFLKTTDRGIIPMFINYLKATKSIQQISNGKQPVYKINYDNIEKLKDGTLAWINPQSNKEEEKNDT